ncbi:hypothetical protein I302_102205 [Kwoniella bestiolae CBS 10118]|uniref:Conserved oligomeric Golgi complex subunit 1 n=1 Tax=Kwoniella bestiolae CBS 10118 TaxID=1296100 RepID=A0A1B9GEE5_9TREE|nr:hypothetical protein I302_00894 [Kwoniella bestiolae CBS 10118]OCF29390.1 hypothetical protein I302_00894 [Kwoniella bestiolae CBS 10118]
MSVRSTPGPSPYPSLPTFHTPDASSSKRSIRTPSYAPRPSIPDPNYKFHRQPSIAPSVTGTSTPTILGVGRRKRNMDGNGGGSGTLTPTSKDDWANMEPDEVFRRLPVNEVRRVESKMRGDALNKQSELRLMVGTRYRDLLTSATQIQSLHSSSLRLSDSLREIARSCINPDVNIVLEGDNLEEDGTANEEDDLINMLPTAAHMKLLLDAPEALYSYLAHHNYLNAAFLWLITRVVKESLNSMPEDQNGAYLPLLQKQWETLLPFRSQIVQRATASLRTKENLDSKSLSETILAIILLDNLPVSDALDLLLYQRTKALRDTLQHVEANAAISPEKEKGNRKRSNSRIQAAAITRSIRQERTTIQSVITDSVTLMLETVSSVKLVFDKPQKQNESLIEEMMRLIQAGDTSKTNTGSSGPPPTARSRQNSHQRRASRLASISLPLKYTPSLGTPSASGDVSKPPITSSEVIQNLPSSQILLRHLPNNIIGFTPFITPSPSPSLSETLNRWQKNSIELLKGSIPDWLKDLKNVKDIWTVRNSLNTLLQIGEFQDSIQQALEDEWGRRVKEVWYEKLGMLVGSAEREVREAGEKVRNGTEKTDTSPESFLFSDIPFPSGPSAAFSASSHNTAFTTFRSTLRKRSSYRTPLLDTVLSGLEESAKSIKEDMLDLPSSLYDDYSIQIKDALDGLIKVLEKVLESMGSTRGDGKDGIEAELSVGRVALYLSKESGFLGDVAGYGKIDRDEIEKALLAVHAKSVNRWKEQAIQEALVSLAPLFEPYRGSQEIKSSWQGDLPSSPSHPIMVSLQSLVKSIRSLGIPPSLNSTLTVMEELVKGFVSSAKDLEGWKTQEKSTESCIQALVDIGFLVNLTGRKVGEEEIIKRFLSQTSSSSSFDLEKLQETIDQSLRKSQLLLYPLLTHLAPTPSSSTSALVGSGKSHSHDRNAALLRFGAPRISGSAGSTEFRSPVVAAKPGKRMGLLSIAA